MWSQPTARRAIVVAGCLGMAYTQLTQSPATVAFVRSLGGGGVHIGIFGALPTALLFTQFFAAILVNHLQFRRRTWIAVSIVQRLMLAPVAAGPFFFPEIPDITWAWLLLAATAMNHALLDFCSPLWLSWMGDYLPRKGLSKFWGVRHLWMQWAAAASLFGAALLLVKSGLAIKPAYAILVGTGAVLGVLDILMFLNVDEPPVARLPEPKLRTVLAGPFKHPEFRRFISFTCFWHFAAMTGAPFISLYLIAEVHMDLYYVLMLWSCSWIGGALFSRKMGQLAEEYGHRPLLVICTAFKSVLMIALLLVPKEPSVAFWILILPFMLDAILNAGIAIANNGFMLKNSPSENRTMYIAAGTALAGMVGGATSILSGVAFTMIGKWTTILGGMTIGVYEILFGLSIVLRLITLLMVRHIRELESFDTTQVVVQLIGITPFRVLRFPVGLYRSMRGQESPAKRRRTARAAATRKREFVASER